MYYYHIYHHNCHKTQYSIRAIPLGGFCSFDSPESLNNAAENGVTDAALDLLPIRQRIFICAAGPIMNILLAFVIAIIFYALQVFATGFAIGTQTGMIIMTMLQYAVIVNVGLGVFNLIPLPPLDGSKVIKPFLPYNAKTWLENNEGIFNIYR